MGHSFWRAESYFTAYSHDTDGHRRFTFIQKRTSVLLRRKEYIKLTVIQFFFKVTKQFLGVFIDPWPQMTTHSNLECSLQNLSHSQGWDHCRWFSGGWDCVSCYCKPNGGNMTEHLVFWHSGTHCYLYLPHADPALPLWLTWHMTC